MRKPFRNGSPIRQESANRLKCLLPIAASWFPRYCRNGLVLRMKNEESMYRNGLSWTEKEMYECKLTRNAESTLLLLTTEVLITNPLPLSVKCFSEFVYFLLKQWMISKNRISLQWKVLPKLFNNIKAFQLFTKVMINHGLLSSGIMREMIYVRLAGLRHVAGGLLFFELSETEYGEAVKVELPT